MHHRWVSQGFTSLDDRASHPCGILHGTPFSVFAKLGPAADAHEQFTAELAGLRLLHQAARVAVPVPVASGLAETTAGALLLYEALPERPRILWPEITPSRTVHISGSKSQPSRSRPLNISTKPAGEREEDCVETGAALC